MTEKYACLILEQTHIAEGTKHLTSSSVSRFEFS